MEIRIYWTIQILHLTLQVSEIHSMIETENFKIRLIRSTYYLSNSQSLCLRAPTENNAQWEVEMVRNTSKANCNFVCDADFRKNLEAMWHKIYELVITSKNSSESINFAYIPASTNVFYHKNDTEEDKKRKLNELINGSEKMKITYFYLKEITEREGDFIFTLGHTKESTAFSFFKWIFKFGKKTPEDGQIDVKNTSKKNPDVPNDVEYTSKENADGLTDVENVSQTNADDPTGVEYMGDSDDEGNDETLDYENIVTLFPHLQSEIPEVIQLNLLEDFLPLKDFGIVVINAIVNILKDSLEAWSELKNKILDYVKKSKNEFSITVGTKFEKHPDWLKTEAYLHIFLIDTKNDTSRIFYIQQYPIPNGKNLRKVCSKNGSCNNKQWKFTNKSISCCTKSEIDIWK